MTDVLLTPTSDGAELTFTNGILSLSLDGLQNALYLSMFGGNEHDSGLDGDVAKEWCLNKDEPVAERKLRSRVQYLLRSIPLTSGNLTRIKDAAQSDLEWLVKSKVASGVSVSVNIPALNTVGIAVNVVIQDKTFSFVFTEAWRARA